ncbi:MAG: ATP-binding cassette domain-containing protein [bacterium]|jgi:osmoprotectant transport system ATP-binding protein|nr:ATP-binding cassette domain-containing protein [Betaproteobacteria bacterium]
MIHTRGLCRSFGGRLALAPLTTTFERGRVTVLLGPSGCGKSTLLRLLIGLVEPDAGSIEIDGVLLGPATIVALRHRTGYVIQDGGLFPHLTARDNITLLARHLRWEPARIRERLAAVAELARIAPRLLDQYPSTLSGGERQRIGIARALLPDPPLLLCDEPLSALDPITRSGLQDELRNLFAALGKTVLWVTHDLHEAAGLAHDILLMRDGQVVQRGGIADLLARPADPFVTLFVRAQQGRLPGEAAGGPAGAPR